MNRDKNLKICSKWSKTRVCKFGEKKSDWQFANFAINIGPGKTSFIFCKKKEFRKTKTNLTNNPKQQFAKFVKKWSRPTICNSIGWEWITNGHLYRKSFPFLIVFGQPHSQSAPKHPSCIVFMTPPPQCPTYLLHCMLRVLSSFLCFFNRSLTSPNLSEWELQSYLANVFPISLF